MTTLRERALAAHEARLREDEARRRGEEEFQRKLDAQGRAWAQMVLRGRFGVEVDLDAFGGNRTEGYTAIVDGLRLVCFPNVRTVVLEGLYDGHCIHVWRSLDLQDVTALGAAIARYEAERGDCPTCRYGQRDSA